MGLDGEVIVVPGNHDRPLVRAWARRADETLQPDSAVPVDASPALARLVSWLGPASVTGVLSRGVARRTRLVDPWPLPRPAPDAGVVIRVRTGGAAPPAAG